MSATTAATAIALTTLDMLPKKSRAIIISVNATNDISLRLMELGFVAGESVRVMAKGFFSGEPIAVRVGGDNSGTTFALRKFEAALISVSVSVSPFL